MSGKAQKKAKNLQASNKAKVDKEQQKPEEVDKTETKTEAISQDDEKPTGYTPFLKRELNVYCSPSTIF